jgi:hypothetical protein
MVRQAKFTTAVLGLIGLLGVAACSGEQGETRVVSEAYAGTPPSQPDYGWRTSEGASAAREDTAFEYQ